MRTMSVRDIRHRWPEAERALAEEGEIIVTRDSVPVARILPIARAPVEARKRVDFDELARWQEEFWKDQPPQRSTDQGLAEDRAERDS